MYACKSKCAKVIERHLTAQSSFDTRQTQDYTINTGVEGVQICIQLSIIYVYVKIPQRGNFFLD